MGPEAEGSPTWLLRSEHKEIAILLNHLDSNLRSLQREGGGGRLARVMELVRELDGTVGPHMNREEVLLFPILRTKLESAGPVDAMIEDHRKITDSVLAVRRLLSGSADRSLEEVPRSALEMASLVRNHMSREDEVLFWLAELRLSSLEKRQLAQKLRRAI